MSKDMNQLENDFWNKIISVLDECKEYGYIMTPYFTVRDVFDQAKLWRQSRPTTQVKEAVSFLYKNGAEWLSEVLDGVGPQSGRWATNALPGMSWHQYGEAIDCFLFDQENNTAIWRASHPGYRFYAKASINSGLVSGFYWKRKDAVHVHKRKGSPGHYYTWIQINEEMKKRYK